MRRVGVAIGLVLAVVATACADEPSYGPDSEQAYAATELTPEPAPELELDDQVHPDDSLVATAAVQNIRAFANPGDEKPLARFEHPGPFGTPRVFLVREDAGKWLRVMLPMEPNGTEGWVRAKDVSLATNPYHVEIDLGAQELTAYERDEVFLRSPVAIGTQETPTPTGLFFSTILAKPDDPTGPYGKYAMGLSGYSEVLTTFAGGDGQIAIHGTNQPALIGTPASHGCVRVTNETITRLAKTLPLGTPVRIHA